MNHSKSVIRWHHNLFTFVFFLLLCGKLLAASTPDAAFDEYIARTEPKYRWEKIEEKSYPQSTYIVLQLTSQTWQGHDWTHRVEITTPVKNEFPDTAFVLASFRSLPGSLVGNLLANQLGATVINVTGIPNQPLWNKREDGLIAHSFRQFLETGDTTWPLLLPMTKSVVAAMKAAQEYSAEQKKPLTKFVIAGASKRGWTTYLTAAADAKRNPNRIIGIIPIVYDNLNIQAQLPHQLESWGEYSEMIADYTKLGLQDQTGSTRGQQLLSIVDPYFYRERLTMPKLLINGANDRYWTLDATRFYLNDLPGQTNLYIAPNAGHSLGGDYLNVLSTASAWFRHIRKGAKLSSPQLTVGAPVGDMHKRILKVVPNFQTEEKPSALRVWMAHSATKDFRDAQWNAKILTTSFASGGEYEFEVQPTADAKYSAAFAEQETIGDNGTTLKLSTPVVIWSNRE